MRYRGPIRVTVVIPTRDRNDTLARCLDRLAPGAQSLAAAQYEVVVSDDSAGVGARDMIAARYPWARWMAGPQRGPAANRNAGAGTARGRLLAFTDDDCLPQRHWLRAFDRAHTEQGRRSDVLEGRTTCRAGVHSPRQTAPMNLTGGVLWSCNFALARELFDRIGGFDERFRFAHMEDADLHARLTKAGIRVRFVAEAEVDHPPRALRWGSGLARPQEASVLYMVLHEEERGLPWYIANHARARLSRIVRDRKSLDTASALLSLPVELGAIALSWRGWVSRAHAAAEPAS